MGADCGTTERVAEESARKADGELGDPLEFERGCQGGGEGCANWGAGNWGERMR